MNIADVDIPGGMLYLGPGVKPLFEVGVEPSAIDPHFPVDLQHPDWTTVVTGWPSYSWMSPQSRAAYLLWLAEGRERQGVSNMFVLVYLSGLERRVVTDLARGRSNMAEIPIIRGEVQRLLSIYPNLRGRLQKLDKLLHILSALLENLAPPPARTERAVMRLKVRLARFAAERQPIPADWALSWVRSRKDHGPWPAATSCAQEFATLFRVRYAARYGQGLIAQSGDRAVGMIYDPVGMSFPRPMGLSLTGLPDIFDQAAITKKLAALGDECAAELDPYHRFVKRVQGGGGTLRGQALLPIDLVDVSSGSVATLADWARQRLGGNENTSVLVAEFAEAVGELGGDLKNDSVGLVTVLDRAGVGVEPDPRFGGQLPFTGSIVLFASEWSNVEASNISDMARLRLFLAVLIGSADGSINRQERSHLSDHIDSMPGLPEGERRRLHAHLCWLAETKVTLKDLCGDVEKIPKRERPSVAAFLARVAVVDGPATPEEVVALTEIYLLLGLKPAHVLRYLKAATPIDPVTVRPARSGQGYVIPRPPEDTPTPQPEPVVRLDPKAVKRKIDETVQVDDLLKTIFTDEDEPPAPQVVPGLDEAHVGLLRALAEVEELSRSRFQQLAGAWNLLPDGALDRLNEAAYELAGEPLLEGDDLIMVNPDVLGEMLT
ncbi:TerB N-terminal domain-containing protein [Streptosporangium sp. CA-115845]|uniref:tellurite resistance TerB family protein n=1 Tax=Streptosporangium sp. CA-115845 TaxID=3240071 RepID=UPI003D8ED675